MKQKAIQIFFLMVFGLLAGYAGAWVFSKQNKGANQQAFYTEKETQSIINGPSTEVSNYSNNSSLETIPLNFVEASSKSTPSVVFIKTISEVRTANPFWFFDGDPFGSIGQVSSTGSGVIMSHDGYIVTNLHVIKNAIKIEVVLNNRKKVYPAKLIGTDPSTDLALLKIEASGLPAIVSGNSDDVLVGEWVLAVGNPFNLTSTVTAGIVSAKGRNINIVNNQFPIESFIQTDAAINPGNSGGALVNTKGQLIGINTAIISKTGSNAGYGFAIPVNIVVKIVKDLVDFGEVQRGFTGMDVADIDYETQQKLKISYESGVYVAKVLEDGPAFKAGIRAGDLIVSLQDKKVEYKSLYDEYLSYQRPGDKIKITFERDGKIKEAVIILINKEGNTDLVRKTYVRSDQIGANFAKISKMEMQKFGIENGVKVFDIGNGLLRRMGIPEDFIFITYNGVPCKEPDALIGMLVKPNGNMQIEGMTPDGKRKFYNFYGY